ncbi:hypothetical protein RA307_02760 [Xanthobacteraceae bacterium Astr-EGSB]|uniref:hypothetical protein n=1 Tax=Astrobacterium formosum TaxID=3069710 RepID=UPI0027B321D1|nr:hypothetical protein [Xanthobacteraceae bacterium Astr-EGSB]
MQKTLARTAANSTTVIAATTAPSSDSGHLTPLLLFPDHVSSHRVALDTALSLLYWDQVAVVLAVIFAAVIAAELIVTSIRRRVL